MEKFIIQEDCEFYGVVNEKLKLLRNFDQARSMSSIF